MFRGPPPTSCLVVAVCSRAAESTSHSKIMEKKKKIREEVKFDSIDLLKSQIKKDIEEAKKILD